MGFRALRIIYKGLFLALTTYAASTWVDKINVKDWSKLSSAQRFALIAVTRAYRTITVEAAQVIAGELPIKLEVQKRCAKYWIRKGLVVTISGIRHTVDRNNKVESAQLRKNLRRDLLNKWQEEWSTTTKGRTTFEFFPSIERRIQMHWIETDYYVTQILSGHGDFNANLHSMKLRDESECECGREDTSRHMLVECDTFVDLRE